jgi:hypothetical protein
MGWVVVVLVARGAWGQYQAVDLTPAGFPAGTGAGILGARGNFAVGITVRPGGGLTDGYIWNTADGSGRSLVDPAVYTWSTAHGTNGTWNVGYGFELVSRDIHAMAWKGFDGKPIDINPTGAWFSEALGTSGDVHVGAADWADDSLNTRAILWSQFNGEHFWSDITPPGAYLAIARGADGIRQVGTVDDKATLWRRTRESAVSLQPSDPLYRASELYQVHGNEEVGSATTTGGNGHAAMWHDTVGSFLDLHPAQLGFSDSVARDTNGRQQVGQLLASNNRAHAVLWTGTAESAVDLHQFLAPGFGRSYAFAIDEAGNIFGNAYDAAGVAHAIEWKVIPEPSAMVLMVLLGVFADAAGGFEEGFLEDVGGIDAALELAVHAEANEGAEAVAEAVEEVAHGAGVAGGGEGDEVVEMGGVGGRGHGPRRKTTG